MPDTMATPLAGAQTAEDSFQSLYDAGAFSPDGAPPADASRPPPERPQLDNAGVEGERQPPAPQTEAPAEQKPEETEKYWESLDQFITENELDPEQFRAIPVTVKIDGQSKNVPLSEVIKSYQLEGHVNNKSVELSNQKRAWEEETKQARQAMMQQWERNEALGKLAVDSLNAEFQKVNWQELRATDPAQYAALQADFNIRNGQIQGYLAQVQQQKAQETQRQETERQQNLAKEYERMLDAHPEWRDQSQFTKDREAIGSYAKLKGFSDAELNQIYDHRYMSILHDAARYQALQASKPQATKLVREAPKMAKPGVRSNRDPQQAARQNALERFNSNPKDMDAQVAYFETLS